MTDTETGALTAVAFAQPRRIPRAPAVGSVIVQLWLPVLLVAGWWFWSARSSIVFYPPLSVILEHFQKLFLSSAATGPVLSSLRHLAAGYVIASVAGILAGVLVASNRWIRYAADPFLSFLRSLPSIAVLPLMIVLLGIGDAMKASIIVFGSAWYVLFNTVDGIAGCDPTRLEMARVYRLSRWERIRYVLIPAAAPQIFSGLRVGLQIAILLMVASEFAASTQGIGYMILNAKQSFQMADMWAGMIFLGLLGFVLNAVFVAAERRILHWYFGAQGAAAAR